MARNRGIRVSNTSSGWLCVLGISLTLFSFSCRDPGPIVIDDPVGDGSDPSSSDVAPDDGLSVGDVVTDLDGPDPESPQPLPPGAAAAARVRNESAFQADITVRFIQADSVVHLAFVRVLPRTITTVLCPKLADLIELFGVDERGLALRSDAFQYGVDFDEITAALYVIPAGVTPGALEPTDLTMLEPAEDVTRTLGSTLRVRWTDTGDIPGTVVRILLRGVGPTASGDRVPAGPAVGAALDGLNDEVLIVVQGVEPGTYEVIGEIDDGETVVTSVAPGLVEVLDDPGNAEPSLAILAPSTLTELHEGDTLEIVWDDSDEDDNATVTFSLVTSDPGLVTSATYVISPPLAEDSDADVVIVTVGGVLPGLYDLVGTIDDGRSQGVTRLLEIIRVLPEPDNDPPFLAFEDPAGDVEVPAGGSFTVRWQDRDENNNALITFLLDPDSDGDQLDGDEKVLVSSLTEDADEPDGWDELVLGIPGDVEPAAYRFVGVITDGQTADVVVWADATIYYSVPLPGGDDVAAQLDFIQPFLEVRTRVGASFEVELLATGIPPGAPVRLYLVNSVLPRIEVTPPDYVANEVTIVPLEADALSNGLWPRRFDLTAEVEVNGDIHTAVADGPVLVRQEVEILDVHTINYSCSFTERPVRDPRGMTGLEVTWFGGGGFEENRPPVTVEFWLSQDRAAPFLGQGDTQRRRVHVAPESPNAGRVTQIELLETGFFPGISGEEGNTPLAPGEYHLLAVVYIEEFGRIVTGSSGDPVPICFRPVFPENP